MQLPEKILLLFLLCLMAGFFPAQSVSESTPPEYRAIHWTGGEDGLPLAYTHTMFKDASGFLWVGGGGSFASELCRFDGAVFKKYFQGHEKRGAISSADIYIFKEDSLHNIWMG